MTYDRVCVEYFLKHQEQLFDEPVAETPEEAEEFLEECMAIVFPGLKEAKRYMKENLDVAGLSDEEILEEAEVFGLPDGRILIVEG